MAAWGAVPPSSAESRIPGHIGPRGDSQRWRYAESARGRVTRQLAEIAARDHKVVSLEDCRSCGLSDSGVRKRVAAGELHRKHSGVFAFGRPDLDRKGVLMAAVKASGPGARVSHASGACLRKMRWSNSSYTDITVPAGRPLLRRKGIRCHRAELQPQDLDEVDGIPTTSVARTLLDLATQIGLRGLESAANEAEVLEIFDMREMEDLLVRSKGHRGIRKLRHVLEHGDLSGRNQTKSGLERMFAMVCAQHGVPQPAINRWILLGDEYLQVDFLWRKEKVVIEVDSNRYHHTGWKLARDQRRDELFASHGYLADRVPEDLLKEHPSDAAAKALALLAARTSR